jgi:hypothetical protein
LDRILFLRGASDQTTAGNMQIFNFFLGPVGVRRVVTTTPSIDRYAGDEKDLVQLGANGFGAPGNFSKTEREALQFFNAPGLARRDLGCDGVGAQSHQ